MIYSAALTSQTNKELIQHLLRADGQEDLCFALWNPSTGIERTSALIYKILLPQDDERNLHGNVSFNPTYFERVLREASEQNAGVAFMHSHLGPGWQNMSEPDKQAEVGMSPAVKAVTNLPLLGMTLGTDGSWSARFWNKTNPKKYQLTWCQTVRVIGQELNVTFCNELLPTPKYKSYLTNVTHPWGKTEQEKLQRLRIGIVGAGSVGSIVAESLARMGVQKIKLLDFDIIEYRNLDRHIHASVNDIGQFKTSIVKDRLNQIAICENITIKEVTYSITEEIGFKEALDCDMLFSCVDRPWPRQALNLIAYAHLIPVIDGGIKVSKNKKGSLLSADWKAHIACPERRCLECLKQFTPNLVSLERDGSLDDPRYISSLDENHELRSNENVIAFSFNLASLEVMQMLSMVINPLGISNTGEFNYHFVNGRLDINENVTCNKNCIYQSLTALGDNTDYEITDKHPNAEEQRSKVNKKS